MNPKIPVRSLKEVPHDQCSGNCPTPLGTHRTIVCDKFGNPLRFGSACNCYRAWLAQGQATAFNIRGTALATQPV